MQASAAASSPSKTRQDTAQAENQRIAFLEDQNMKYDNENQALRQAQIEMEERHTAEVIELK